MIFLLLVGLSVFTDETVDVSTDIDRRASLGEETEDPTEVSKDKFPGGKMVSEAEGIERCKSVLVREGASGEAWAEQRQKMIGLWRMNQPKVTWLLKLRALILEISKSSLELRSRNLRRVM